MQAIGARPIRNRHISLAIEDGCLCQHQSKRQKKEGKEKSHGDAICKPL
jgi:hypothetical protein